MSDAFLVRVGGRVDVFASAAAAHARACNLSAHDPARVGVFVFTAEGRTAALAIYLDGQAVKIQSIECVL